MLRGRARNSRLLVPITLMACFLGASVALWADIVQLKTGGVLRGEIVNRDDKTITLRMRVGTMKILRSRIRSIREEPRKPTSPVKTEAPSLAEKHLRIPARNLKLEEEATLLADLGRHREALEVFRKLEVDDPRSADRYQRTIARCHAGYGRRLLELKRFTHGRSEYDQAVKLDPELLPQIRHEVMVARFSPIVTEINTKGGTLSRGRLETLVAELKAIIPLEPKNPHLHFALAVCYHELKRFEDAAREYALITGVAPDLEGLPDSLAPLQLAAKNKTESAPIMLDFAKPRFTAVLPGAPRKLETEHFVIHHHNDELARLVARGAEYYVRRNYRVFLDEMPANAWSRKCDITLYRTREEYLKNSHQADWSPAMASTSGVGGSLVSHHIKTYQSVENLLSSHLSHELTHIIHGAVVNYEGRLPTWLREGIAVRQEPWFKRLRMARAIREARRRGDAMTLDEILNQRGYPDEDSVRLFYAQSYTLVEMLERAGTSKQFLAFNRRVLREKPLDALHGVYGLDKSEIVRRWRKHEKGLISLLDTP